MTRETFFEWYPQFRDTVPEAVLTDILRRANARFGEYGEDTEAARQLFAAHRVVMHLRAAASGGERPSRITGKRVGEVQVSYAAPASAGDFEETVYGMELLGLARLHFGTKYVE